MLLSLLVRAFIIPPTTTFALTCLPNARASKVLRHARSTMSSPFSAETALLPAFKTLVSKLGIITHLRRVQYVLVYDQHVFMPDQASADRAAQMSALAALIHEKSTEPALKEAIQASAKEVADSDNFDAKRLLELEQKKLEENERISTELASKAASLASSAYGVWVEAKSKNDFASFAPVLEECFQTSMKVSTAKRGDKQISLYTQMLDEYETGMSQDRIDNVFDEIRTALVPLIAQVLESNNKPSTDSLHGSFDIETQKALCEEIVSKLGYDKRMGRIDVSVHPSTIPCSPNDVRITSRYRTDEWYQGLAAMIHESGHAMYEQNLGNSATSIDSALSMGTHESQSLFWERHVGLGMPFWKWAMPFLQKHFPQNFADATPEQIYGAVNALRPGLIRVDADELTYPLHVILRYEIERDVISGALEVKDIPHRWQKDMKAMLGVDVPSDEEGCLQDIHWATLAFGYFPTYLIGSATAAQLAHYCRKDLPLDELIEKGDFAPIKAWLTTRIHCHGKRFKSLDDLLEDQVGEKLNPKYLIEYLQAKYYALYKL